ncbi:hypothetical protein [Salinicoccus sp. HZC-1]|uniref:hypothetical protein n=1 Tax=Salinicoccus sp. HZC-1 TaxID=3385497 RepID=UPI00398B0B77
MNSISQLLTGNIKLTLLLIGIVQLVSVIVMILMQHHFHTEEINILINGAVARDENYELVIHNELTQAYSFRIK